MLAALGAAASVLAPRAAAGPWFEVVWQGTMAVFLANGLQFQWHAWRPGPQGREGQHVLLALCWLVFVAVALDNLFSVLDRWQVARDWAALSGLLVIVLVMMLLCGRLILQLRGMERSTQTLAQRVAEARAELARALAREHAQAVENATLQERTRLAHDLHDGLGASLTRGMSVVEQAQRAHQPLASERVLSLLKQLRDDLRQVIDYGSSAAASVPASPQLWMAPVRHRFTRILDEIGMASEWHLPAQWQAGAEWPAMLQCLNLARIVEEALANAIKHSGARRVRVRCDLDTPGWLAIQVEDDGRGFDVRLVQGPGLGIGLGSMAARAARIGGMLRVESAPGRTVVRVSVPLG